NIEMPWSVNSYANAAGRCIFKNSGYIERTKEYIRKEREYLTCELSEIKWIRVFKSDANFILLKLLEYDEDIVFERLIKNGIMVRKASNFEGLDRRFIRIAVKDHDSNKKLIKLLKEFE
ncbi:MAG TPA: aspartate aminotransferase, partial [Clostridiaceae bacterium]|nr:aspartate aminotransferase [Clostridiaceae bacterium]